MTASLLNLSSIAAPGQAPAGGAVQPGAAAGFDALLAAFFGEGQAVDPALAGLLGAQVQAAQPGVAVDAAEPEGSGEVVEGEAAPAAPEAALALIAALAAPVTAAATPALTQAAAPTADAAPDAPLAWGQAKAAGVPAAPALENADPHADLAAKAAEAMAQDAAAGEPGRSAAAQAPRDAGLGKPAAPVMTPTAPPAAQPAPVAAAPEAPQAPAPPPATAAVAAMASETAEVVVPPPQPAPVREKASGKPERAQGADTPTVRTEAFAAAARGTAPAPRVGGAEAFAADAPEGQAAGVETAALEAAAIEPEAPADGPDAAGPTQTGSTASTAQAAPPPAHTQVRGSPETVANLAAQILKKLDGRSTRFDVELTPAGMGRVDVRVEIDHLGRVSAAMAFDNPQAAKELQARSGELQKALEQAGFDLSGGMSFDVTGDQGRGRQDLAERWADHEAGAGSRGRAFKEALATAGEADTGAASALNLRRGLRSGVDVRI